MARGVLRAVTPVVNADLQPKTSSPELRREEHAGAWSSALWRYCPALAGKFRWRPKSVEEWAQIQSLQPSPTERTEMAVEGLRSLGVPEHEAIAPVDTLARRLGYRLLSRLPLEGTFGSPMAALTDALNRFNGMCKAFGAVDDGEVTAAELAAFEEAKRLFHEAEKRMDCHIERLRTKGARA